MGNISSSDQAHNKKQTQLKLIKVDHKNEEIHLLINSEPVVVQITADSKKGHHFVNPHYELNYKGENISFRLENGMACYGCSINLIFMILGLISTSMKNKILLLFE